MKASNYIILISLGAVVTFLCFRYSKEERLKRQIDTYKRRVKEYKEKDSLNNASGKQDTLVNF